MEEWVLDAYGWPHELSDEDILDGVISINQPTAI
jgi:hypothetical protein